MIKLKKWLIVASFLFLLILTAGCKLTGKTGTSKDSKSAKSIEDIRVGTQGIIMSFLPNAPPERIHVESGIDNPPFFVVLELKNKGAYPQPDEPPSSRVLSNLGRLYLSGFDTKILKLKDKNDAEKNNIDLNDKNLEGKSTINPNGGSDIVEFKGFVDVKNLNVEKYEPTLLATVCYGYQTVAGPSVCIDPDPYASVKQKKVCEVQSISLNSQGAPVAITKIDSEAFAAKTQFRITIKNVGGGEVIKTARGIQELLEKCDPSSDKKVSREDVDRVFIVDVKISDKDLECGPFAEEPVRGINGVVRLVNGEGYIICELKKEDYGKSATAFTTPLKIKLVYGYRTTAERKLQIKRESTIAIRESNNYQSIDYGDSAT